MINIDNPRNLTSTPDRKDPYIRPSGLEDPTEPSRESRVASPGAGAWGWGDEPGLERHCRYTRWHFWLRMADQTPRVDAPWPRRPHENSVGCFKTKPRAQMQTSGNRTENTVLSHSGHG